MISSGQSAGTGALELSRVVDRLAAGKELPPPPSTHKGRARLLLVLTKLFFVATILAVPLIATLFAAAPLLLRVVFGMELPSFLNQILLLAAIGTVTAFLASLKKRRGPGAPRIELERAEHEELFGLVDAISSSLDTRPPDAIIFSETPRFAVLEEGSAWFGGRRHRTLFLDATGLLRLSIAEFASIIIHEMAHFSERHTIYALKLHQTFGTLLRFGQNLRRKPLWFLNPIHYLTALFFRLFARLYYPISRSFELEADAMAVRLLGRTAFARGLKKQLAAGVVVSSRLGGILDRAMQSKNKKENLFETMRSESQGGALNSREKAAIEREVKKRSGPYSTHPSYSERIEHADGLVPSAGGGEDAARIACRSADAMDFFLGPSRRKLEVSLSRLLIEEAQANWLTADEEILSIGKRSTEKWLLTLFAALVTLGTVLALCVFAWSSAALYDERWELTVAIPPAALFLAWALRCRKEGVVATDRGIIAVGAFTKRLIRWERIAAVRMGLFSNKVFGERKGKTVKIVFDGSKDENRLMVDTILARSPALGALGWGIGLSGVEKPPPTVVSPRKATINSHDGEIVIEGPGKSLVRFESKRTDYEQISRCVTARLVPLIAERT